MIQSQSDTASSAAILAAKAKDSAERWTTAAAKGQVGHSARESVCGADLVEGPFSCQELPAGRGT